VLLLREYHNYIYPLADGNSIAPELPTSSGIKCF